MGKSYGSWCKFDVYYPFQVPISTRQPAGSPLASAERAPPDIAHCMARGASGAETGILYHSPLTFDPGLDYPYPVALTSVMPDRLSSGSATRQDLHFLLARRRS
jgi:hypothetical protein